ncbi:hydrolase [Sphingopyxis terrae subsp. ummariensis]|uniref:Altronate hydrolase n=1 Tax=Sphingopyxis terrae subsp. ummariensis TaxID=429001 RepID=A0A1Y6FSL4_9SPHN|nr:UxaA family hydrolase [Sphingopyxis terrae]PCF91178.1 hydrolase [Sphingopyxis terrae subsp. ummariensis]SMQ76170.1 altronate hydrolase [Sphingopyxis terrae subsp. ummariensis]
MIIGEAFLRADGRKGIRNVVAVVYLVECAHHVARRVVDRADDPDVHLLGFPGCYPNDYALRMLKALVTHPNVGGAVLVSLGCEGFDREGLAAFVAASGRPVETVVIQEAGGTRSGIDAALQAVRRVQAAMRIDERRTPMTLAELSIGTICGGSDGTSGIAANPAVGRAFDRLIDAGATCIFEETGEMIGCEGAMSVRAASPVVAEAINQSIANAERYYRAMGYGSFSPGNAEGGLSTLEEKSAGAYVKSGSRPISGVIRPAQAPEGPGLYLLDVVPAEPPRFGFPNISDNAEIVELMSCGVHLTLFTTGRGSVVGSAIAPVVKITGNPETYARMRDDMDVDAGRIMQGEATLDDLGHELFDLVVAIAGGAQTKSEELGHREFILGYKSIEAAGPACHPGGR